MIESISGKPMRHEYVDQNREGDHICYIPNLQKMKAHYPGWDIAKDLKTTFAEIHAAWMKRISGAAPSRLPSDEAASSRQFGSQSPKKTSSRMA